MPIELMYEHERIRLERKFIKLRASYYSKRNEIVNNGDGGAGGGIEQFWLMCLKNNPALNTRVKDRDEECLKYLTNIRCVYPEGSAAADEDSAGAFASILASVDATSKFNTFNLELHFRENPYFSNSVLVKRYLLKALLLPVAKSQSCLAALAPTLPGRTA